MTDEYISEKNLKLINEYLYKLYISINIITIDDIPSYLRAEVNATNFFCKRILSLSRILKQENIKIEYIKKERLRFMLKKYMDINGDSLYSLPNDPELYRLECPYAVLFAAIDEIPEFD